jgi:DNA-3-methyladenine glycosylase
LAEAETPDVSAKRGVDRASVLPRDFYDREVTQVARDLLGKYFVRVSDDGPTAGRIVEVEAYLGRDDPASHAFRGQTRRNATMFGPPGYAYVYAIHSRWCVNVTTEPEGTPSAVLIRAVEPLVGLPLMHRRRCARKARSEPERKRGATTGLSAGRYGRVGRERQRALAAPAAPLSPAQLRDLARGPARLCEAFAIDRTLDAWDLTRRETLWITATPPDRVPLLSEQCSDAGGAATSAVRHTPPHIVTTPRIGVTSAHDLPLRFFFADNPFVSKPRVR